MENPITDLSQLDMDIGSDRKPNFKQPTISRFENGFEEGFCLNIFYKRSRILNLRHRGFNYAK